MVKGRTWSLYDPAEEVGSSWPARVYPYELGVVGGVLGGLGMVLVALIYGLVSGRGIWLPINLIGATVVRDLQQASPEQLMQFHAAAAGVGLMIHLALAALVGWLFVMLLPTLPGNTLVWAVVIGPLLWALAFVIMPLVNPVMGRNIEPISFALAHIFYGLIMGIWVSRHDQVDVVE
jgi:hypothetical protein